MNAACDNAETCSTMRLLLLAALAVSLGACVRGMGSSSHTDSGAAADASPADGIMDGFKPPADLGLAAEAQTIDAPREEAPQPDASQPDAPQPDAFVCPDVCSGGCANGVCTVDCSSEYSCVGQVACPPGIPCEVTCGYESCDGEIDCSEASSCTIECTGEYACEGSITCGSGTCTVICAGYACSGPIDCSMASQCSINCFDDYACEGSITCGSGRCEVACAGDYACTDAISCDQSCACSVQCSSPLSCGGGIVCPPSCSGCSPNDGCDTCP